MKSAFFASLMVLGAAQVGLPQIVNHTQRTGPYASLSAAQADERTRDGDVLVVSGPFQEDSVFHLVKSLTVSGGGFVMYGGIHCGTAGRSLTLSNLIVDGSAVPGTNHGIHQGWAGTPGCSFTLNQVTIRNFRGKGLYLQGGAHGYSNLVISAVGQTGVHVRDSRLSGTGLSVHGCGGDAIELQDGGDWEARGVTTLRNSGGGGHGILEGGSGVYVFETLNLDNVENGIHHGFGDGGRLTIHGGTWQNLRKHAVQVGQEDDSNEGPNKIWTLNQVTLLSTRDANIRYWGLDFGGTPRAHTLILNRCTVLDTNHHFLEQKQQSNSKAVFQATDCKVDKGNARVDFFMTYGSPEGGSFTFEKCTIQNFGGFNHDGALYYNWDLCNNVPPTSRQSVTFRNCLIENFGNHTVCITDDELGLRPDYVGSNTLTFEGCTLRNVAQGPDRHAFALWRGNNTLTVKDSLIEGFQDHGIDIRSGHNTIRLINTKIRQSARYDAIRLGSSLEPGTDNNLWIDGCEFTDVNNGIAFSSPSDGSLTGTRIELRNTRIHGGNGPSGKPNSLTQATPGNTARIYDPPPAHGIHFGNNASGITLNIDRCVFYDFPHGSALRMDGAQASHNAVALTRSTFYHQRGCWVVKDSAGDGNKISASYCVYAHNESSTYFIADEKNSGLCSDNYSLFCDDLGVNHTRRTGWLAEDKVTYSLLNHAPDANTTHGVLLGAGTRHDIDLGDTFWSVVEGELFFLYLGPHSLAVDIGGLGQDAGALPRKR